MSHLLGLHDLIILSAISLVLFFIWKKNIRIFIKTWWLISWGLAFFIVLPFISSEIEVRIVKMQYEMTEGFNLLYILLRWPTYWLLGIFGAIGLFLFARSRIKNSENTL